MMDDYIADVDRHSAILHAVLEDERFNQQDIVTLLSLRMMSQMIGFAYNQEIISGRGKYPRATRTILTSELERIKSQKNFDTIRAAIMEAIDQNKGGIVALRTKHQQD